MRRAMMACAGIGILTGVAVSQMGDDRFGLPEQVDVAFDSAVWSDLGAGALKLPYRLMRPEAQDRDAKYPLVVFLHGFGERGEDNHRQLLNGGPEFVDPDLRGRHPAFVLAPQCPEGIEPTTGKDRAWVFRLAPGGPANFEMDRAPTVQLGEVHTLVEHLLATEPIDPDRVYLIGLSMGGYAVWEEAMRHPEMYACAVPICGGGDVRYADRLVGMPVWAFHGAADNVVPPQRTTEVVDAINAKGGRAILTMYPGVGHGSWVPAFRSREMWDWMFAQRREP